MASLSLQQLFIVALFLCQLITISLFVSTTWRKSRKQLLDNYPQQTFPNLYVQTAQTEFFRLRVRKWLDIFAFCTGCATLLLGLVSGTSITQLSKYFVYVAALQMFPLFLSGYWCSNNNHLMSKKRPTKKRSAAMATQRIPHAFPMDKMLLVGISFLASVLLVLLLPSAFDSDEWQKATKLLVLNAFVVVCISGIYLHALYGKKADNFASLDELRLKLAIKLRYLSNSLIAFNFIILLLIVLKLTTANFSIVYIISSIFVQVIVFTTKDQYFPIQPSVYKDEM